MEISYIYLIKDPRSESIKMYIGKTTNPKVRFRVHLTEKNKNTIKSKWISHLLGMGLIPVFELIRCVPKSEESFWEMHYISLYKSWGFILTNGTSGGEGGDVSKSLTCEGRRKKSIFISERNQTAKMIVVMSKAKEGVKNPLLAQKNKERVWTKALKDKCSQAQKERFTINGIMKRRNKSVVKAIRNVQGNFRIAS